MADEISPHNSHSSFTPEVMFHMNLLLPAGKLWAQNDANAFLKRKIILFWKDCKWCRLGEKRYAEHRVCWLETFFISFLCFYASLTSWKFGSLKLLLLCSPYSRITCWGKKRICVVRACTDNKKCFRALICKPRTNGCKQSELTIYSFACDTLRDHLRVTVPPFLTWARLKKECL